MRLVPILAAILVSALIYVFIFQRDAVTGGDTADASTGQETAGAEASSEDDTSASDVIGVIAVKSTARAIDSAVILRGQTEADREVDLRAETSGQVISDPLRKGAFVDQGQLLCRLDPAARDATLAEARARLQEAKSRIPEAQARVDEALARLEEAKINDNAASRLSEGGFASETRVAATKAAVSSAMAGVETARSGLEATQSGIQSAEAAVAAAETEIKRLEITAPFSGLLESDTAELGSLLQPGELCATVVQLDPVMLVGFVPETEVNRVKLGARAGGRLADGVDITGEVTFLSRAADEETRTFRVEIEVPNPKLTLRDGQTAEIIIAADGTNAHLLPQSALTLNDEGLLGVRIVTEDAMAQFVPVTLLRDTPSGVWLAGLPDEAEVIIIGQEFVTDGVRVAPTFQELSQ